MTWQPKPHAKTTGQRGYDLAHKRERERWLPIVASGQAFCSEPVCLEPTRHIRPDEPWDLSHTADRTGWLGPSHRRCNRAESHLHAVDDDRRRLPRVLRDHPLLGPACQPLVERSEVRVPVFERPPGVPHKPR
jgi:hypothetical protein